MRDERVRKGSGEEAVEATESASPTSSPPPVPSVDPAPQGEGEEEKLEAELKDLVSGLERERDEYLALARRTKADFENYRKRVSREASEAEARGRASPGSDLLSVVDNLERALAAMEGAQDQFVE